MRKLFDEDQVNTYITSDQLYPYVAALEGANTGSYVVVWQSDGQDGAGYGIHAQRYNAQRCPRWAPNSRSTPTHPQPRRKPA